MLVRAQNQQTLSVDRGDRCVDRAPTRRRGAEAGCPFRHAGIVRDNRHAACGDTAEEGA